MYLETVKQITDVENEMEQAKTAARAQVQQKLTEAERAGRELLERTRMEGRTLREKALAQAAAQAEVCRTVTLRDAGETCESLRRTAALQMERAADEIVRRVVER